MSGFKRFCMIAFALLGCLVLGALLLPWTGPWAAWATGLFALDWFLYLVEGVALCAFVGFVCVFISGVRSRGQHDIKVEAGDGATVTIARSAIASQATYLVEEDGTCIATKVNVKSHHDRVDVSIQVEPYESLDVRAEAAKLEKRLRSGLTVLVGDRLGDLTLRFLEPRKTGDITSGTDVHEDKDGDYTPTVVHDADRELRHATGQEPEPATDYGVSVPLDKPTAVIPPDSTGPVAVHVEPSSTSASEGE